MWKIEIKHRLVQKKRDKHLESITFTFLARITTKIEVTFCTILFIETNNTAQIDLPY